MLALYSPFCMIHFDLYQSAHVMHKICYRYADFCSVHSNTFEHQSTHCLLHKAEEVFLQVAYLEFHPISHRAHCPGS